MKKSILFTLPIIATMLASCGSKSATKNPVVDPNKGTEVQASVGAQNLLNAAQVTTNTSALGVKFTEGAALDVTVNMPVGSDEQGNITTGAVKVKGDSESSLQVGAKNLDQKGVTGIRASTQLSGSFNYTVTADESVGIDLGEYASMSKKPEANAYFDGSRAYFDLNEDLISLAKLTGGEIGIEAGKYCTPEIPDEAVSAYSEIKVSDVIAQYLQEYSSTVSSYLQLIPSLVGDYGEVKYLQMSDTEFALYVKLEAKTLIPALMAQYAQSGTEINAIVGALDEKDVATVEASILYDTQKGVEEVAAYVNVDVDLTFGELYGAMYGEEMISALPEKTRNTKFVDAEVEVALDLEVLTGSAVKVAELSDSEKANYQEIGEGTSTPTNR